MRTIKLKKVKENAIGYDYLELFHIIPGDTTMDTYLFIAHSKNGTRTIERFWKQDVADIFESYEVVD